MAFSCPNCYSDNTRKVSLIYSEGTSESYGAAAYFGSDGNDAYIPMASIHRTKKAQSVAPPQKKHSYWFVWYIVLFPIFVVIFVIEFPYNADLSDYASRYFFLWIATSSLIAVPLKLRAERYNEIVWKPLIEAWRMMFLCDRCGTKFIGGN